MKFLSVSGLVVLRLQLDRVEIEWEKQPLYLTGAQLFHVLSRFIYVIPSRSGHIALLD